MELGGLAAADTELRPDLLPGGDLAGRELARVVSLDFLIGAAGRSAVRS